MEFSHALDQLTLWCQQSLGKPLDGFPKDRAVFQSRTLHSEAELRDVESHLGFSFPDSYRRFMSTIGASSLFCWGVNGGGPVFYPPEVILQASDEATFVDDEGQEHRFCFVGEHRLMGDLMGFLISRPGPRTFDVFCHEYAFEEYVSVSDEINSWRTFDEWLVHAVETHGMESI